jgi:hypothetical protein
MERWCIDKFNLHFSYPWQRRKENSPESSGPEKNELFGECMWTWSHWFCIPEDCKSISFLIKQHTQGMKRQETLVNWLVTFIHWTKRKQSKLGVLRGQLQTLVFLKGLPLCKYQRKKFVTLTFLSSIFWQIVSIPSIFSETPMYHYHHLNIISSSPPLPLSFSFFLLL